MSAPDALPPVSAADTLGIDRIGVMADALDQSQEAYTDRNLLAQLVAVLADERGWDVGYAVDPQEPDWPVLIIDLPTGQISYHLPRAECSAVLGSAPAPWDGHTTEQKRDRIRALLTYVVE